MDTSGLQEFMAGIIVNVSQPFDIIEKYHHHHLHQNNHHQQQQINIHHLQHFQQQQQSQSNNNSQSQNNIAFSLFDFPFSPESSKLAYNSPANQDNGGMDTPNNNDGESSRLTGEIVNSDDGLNIAAESGSISFMRDGSKGPKKSLDKGSDEYKKRRERNNVAVRKSREKAKQRSKDTEKRVSELTNENDNLKRTVTDLSCKMGVLRRLLDEVGVAPDYIEDELNRTKGSGSAY